MAPSIEKLKLPPAWVAVALGGGGDKAERQSGVTKPYGPTLQTPAAAAGHSHGAILSQLANWFVAPCDHRAGARSKSQRAEQHMLCS